MKRQIPLASAIVLLIFNIGGMGWYASAKQNYESAYNSRKMVLASEKMLSTLQDIEIGQRGYTISHSEIYLEPYNVGITTIGQRMADLEIYRDIDPDKIDKIKVFTQKMIEHLEMLVNMTKEGKDEEVKKIFKDGDGKKIMDNIRALTIEVEKSATLHEVENRSKVRIAFSVANILMFLNTVECCILGFLLLFRLAMTVE